MSALASKLVTKEMEWQANMTEQNHLGKALIIAPDKIGGSMDRLFSATNYYSDNPLSSMLMGSIGEEEINGTSWEWDMKGGDTRPFIVVEDAMKFGGATPLVYGNKTGKIKIKLDLNWLKPGDTIKPGRGPAALQIRINSNPLPHGEGFIYEGECNPRGIEAKYFRPNEPWVKMYSTYEEGAEQSGSTSTSTPISLTNKISKYRKSYKITDYASTEVLSVAVPDSNGNLHNMWMKYAEVEFWKQWYREIERGLWYGRDNQFTGSTGRQVRMGAGLQQQLEDSHTHVYSVLSAKLIEEFLMDIFYSRKAPGKGRKVVGYTGEYGMLIFHRVLQEFGTKSGFVKNIEVFTRKKSTDLNINTLEIGMQYNVYHMANGASLTLVHNPIYDDRDINMEIDPVSGFPVESQRITFLDFTGESSKESNIKLIKKKDSDFLSYINGNFTPYGPQRGGNASHAGDYYEMHTGKSVGVSIGDITKCGELILGRN